MTYQKYLTVALTAAALAFPSVSAQARGTDNQTKATIAGAVAGAALTGAMGGNGQSMLLGAAAGGLAGNAYAYHNKKMNQQESRQYRHYKKASHKKYRKAKARRYRHWD